MFAAEFEPAQQGLRRSGRASVSLDGRLEAGGLDRALCKVLDLSLHGCRLQSYSELVRGSAIWLTLPGIAPIGAEIRWSIDFIAGCQFDRPLSKAAFDRLAGL